MTIIELTTEAGTAIGAGLATGALLDGPPACQGPGKGLGC
jgi:hypothetical protein